MRQDERSTQFATGGVLELQRYVPLCIDHTGLAPEDVIVLRTMNRKH
jgi:hypothetical protein